MILSIIALIAAQSLAPNSAPVLPECARYSALVTDASLIVAPSAKGVVPTPETQALLQMRQEIATAIDMPNVDADRLAPVLRAELKLRQQVTARLQAAGLDCVIAQARVAPTEKRALIWRGLKPRTPTSNTQPPAGKIAPRPAKPTSGAS